MPVAAAEALLDLVRRALGPRLAPGRLHPRDVGRMNGGPAAPMQLLARQSGVVDQPLVPVAHRAVGQVRPHVVGDGFRQQPEALLALLQPLLGALAVRHIDDGADVFDELAAVVGNRAGQAQNVPDRSVGPNDPALDFEVGLVAYEPIEGLLHAGPIIRVNPSQRAGVRGSDGLGVDTDDPEVLRRPQELVRRHVPAPASRVAEALRVGQRGFTSPQLFLGAFSIGDVPLKDGDAAIRDGTDAILDPFARRGVVMLVRDRQSFAHDLAEHRLGRRVGELLPDDFPDEGRRILAEAPQLRFRVRIELDHPPVPVEGEKPVGHGVDDRPGAVELGQRLGPSFLGLGRAHVRE